MPRRPSQRPPSPSPDPAGAGAPTAAAPPNPSRIFDIPEEIKFLQAEQVGALVAAFRDWRDQARGPRQRQSRGRVWLTFLLLRFSAARLGEVLALDDRQDLDLAAGQVSLGRGGEDQPQGGRPVQLPEDLVAELRAFLQDPANQALRGQVFRLDQGYVRRHFLARAAQCGLPRELANPRVLRNSRAIELLRQGVPLTIVQQLLGQGSANLTAGLLTFAREDQERIVRYHLDKETRLRTSARNSFRGRVTGIVKGALLSEVELTTSGGYRIVSVITNRSLQSLGLRRGRPLTALVKAPWVIVASGPEPPRLSAENRLRGRLERLEGDRLSCEAIVGLDDGTQVCAVITQGSLRGLGLAVGQEVWVIFQGSAVILTVD